MYISFWISVLFFFWINADEWNCWIIGCSIILLLFWGNYTVFHSGYTNLHSQQQCMRVFLLHILTNICYLLSDINHFERCELMSEVWVVVFIFISWLLVMLNIFSCVCWPFKYFLWKNVYSDLLTMFFFVGLFIFWCWVVWVLCIFWILTPYQIYHWQIPSLSVDGLSFCW